MKKFVIIICIVVFFMFLIIFKQGSGISPQENKIIDQQLVPNESNGYTTSDLCGKKRTSQSFIVSEDGEFFIHTLFRKIGYPSDELMILIGEETQNDIIASFSFSVKEIPEWIITEPIKLYKDRLYWIVPTSNECDTKNYYQWYGDSGEDTQYDFGGSFDTIDDGKTWKPYIPEDMSFKVLFR